MSKKFSTKALTLDEARADFGQWRVEGLRQKGKVAPSVGVTVPVDRKAMSNSQNYTQDLMSNYRRRKGMRDYSASYREDVYGFLKDREGFKTKAYKDTEGLVTIGVGFNMDQPDARSMFSKALPTVDFDEVYSGNKELNDEQVRTLFDGIIGQYESIVDKKMGDTELSEHQRVALVSLAFNSPSLIGPNLTRFVKEGNWKDATEEILFRSNRKKHKGLQNRRVLEAQLFAGGGQPISKDAIAASYGTEYVPVFG